MTTLRCSGWWEEEGYGRQPMSDLTLSFSEGKLSGSGFDIVGKFVFQGRLTDDRIYLFKQYLGQHAIEYFGTSIGEGIYTGDWTCYGEVGGKWLIRIERSVDTSNRGSDEIQDL
jgi:hypothetical protein